MFLTTQHDIVKQWKYINKIMVELVKPLMWELENNMTATDLWDRLIAPMLIKIIFKYRDL